METTSAPVMWQIMLSTPYPVEHALNMSLSLPPGTPFVSPGSPLPCSTEQQVERGRATSATIVAKVGTHSTRKQAGSTTRKLSHTFRSVPGSTETTAVRLKVLH